MWNCCKAAVLTVAVSWVFLSLAFASDTASVTKYKGKFKDGATYLIQVPSNWNGTLILYSHGYVIPGSNNPAEDVGDPITGSYLLASGYALGGSSFATTGWAVEQALPDQISVLDKFQTLVGKPKRTIAWGHSLGGLITAGLVQNYPSRFDAALPMCGVIAGGVGVWNEALDAAFAFDVLLGKKAGLQLVNIKNPANNFAKAEKLLNKTQKSKPGRARIALASALGDLPGWFDPLSKEPGTADYTAWEKNQYLWLQQVDFPFAFYLRAELEGRAGGNPSWNNGISYSTQLQASADYAEVKGLYQKAGLNLESDLAELENAKRIRADQSAIDYLKKNIIFDGDIGFPVLTMHTKGDGLAVVENETAYGDVVREAGNSKLLRDLFIHRAGHCEFTPAETLAAFAALSYRLDKGDWPDLSAATLNDAATALGSKYNVLLVDGKKVPVAPAYIKFTPGPFLRPYDAGKN
jgi:pimeloyl-ACP methyl ester carboxylesterase